MAVALALGLVGGLLARKGADLPLAVQLGGLALIVALVYPASLPWWRKMDEMARQAHLVSWFWGASIGGGVVTAAAAALFVRGGVSRDFFHGAALVFLAQAAVSVAFWAVWWLRRRGEAA